MIQGCIVASIQDHICQEQDKSSDIEEHPPFGDRKKVHLLKCARARVCVCVGGGGGE